MSRRERKLLRRQGKEYRPEEPEKKQDAAAALVEHKKQKIHPIFQFYEKYNVKLMWITVILLALSLIVIGVHTAVKGEFIPRGISLKGGITVTVPYEGSHFSPEELQTYLESEFSGASISVRAMSTAGKNIGFIIDASDVDPNELVKSIEKKTGKLEKFSVETMESALGQAFFKQTVMAMLVAFVLMSIVVFLSFKTFVPSGAVILCGFSDIVMTIAVIDIFNIKIETAGIAALLMLIGYSVDTDVLLTTRVLKREEGTLMEKILGAMKTGMTMTITAIVAVLVAYIFTQSDTLRQIMLILMIGLFFDILNTWIQNTGILTLYVRHKAKKHAAATLSDYKETKEAEFEEIVDLEKETEEDAEEEKEEKKEEAKHTSEHKPAHTEHHEHTSEPKHEQHKHEEHHAHPHHEKAEEQK